MRYPLRKREIMKILERNKAIELRKQGNTLHEIAQKIPVSKGSLSYWLRDIKLSAKQLKRIEYKNSMIKDKFIHFNELRSKEARRDKDIIISNAGAEIEKLSDYELKLIGIALYWAEGCKGLANSSVEFTNSDPAMIKLMMRWFRSACEVKEDRFRIRIQLHDDDKIEKSLRYWSGITNIPLTQFTKPYTKISPGSRQKTGNIIPNGICSIRIGDVRLLTRIKGWINRFMALSSSLV